MRVMIKNISSFKDFESFMMKKYSKLIDFDISLYSKSKEEEEHIYLFRIKIVKNKRRKGIGTQFMNDLCSYANFKNIHIRLTPIALDDEINQKRLEQFYKKFGFKKIYKIDTMRKAPMKSDNKSIKTEIL
jgi:predicted GNAT family N-acyltransferase